jgi:hypothetical protein
MLYQCSELMKQQQLRFSPRSRDENFHQILALLKCDEKINLA